MVIKNDFIIIRFKIVMRLETGVLNKKYFPDYRFAFLFKQEKIMI